MHGQSLSYAELNKRANKLAHYLISIGVKANDSVALCLARSIELPIAVLAILKSGASYVPMDAEYPLERLKYMLEDCAPSVLLLHEKIDVTLQEQLKGYIPKKTSFVRLNVNAEAENCETTWQNLPESNPKVNEVGPFSIAYVIYTSGSTGLPKGVMVPHIGACNLAHAQRSGFDIPVGSRVLQFASSSFDAFVWEFIMALCNGSALCLVESSSELSGEFLAKTVNDDHITHATIPPAVLASVPEALSFSTVRTLIVAGEAPSQALAQRWSENALFINAYGPTETSVCATMFHYKRVDDDISSTPPIGKPIANTTVYIVDKHLNPVPVGVAGELLIGGAGLATGYLNKLELTRERFIVSPFNKNDIVYRTGDLARWRDDGNIEFIGRNDFQVKIRGFRIELGEIENQLLNCDGVEAVYVIAKQDKAENAALVAYVVGDDSISAKVLKQYLADKLPSHMLPAAYLVLDKLPLTVNGKVDRKALPQPDSNIYLRQSYEAPLGDIECKLAALWSELLDVDDVGRHDHFFDLGGHSILAVRLLGRIQKRFATEVSFKQIFSAPDLKGMAGQIQDLDSQTLPSIGEVKREQEIPASYAQQRLWVLEKMGDGGAAYHIPLNLRLLGALNVQALEKSLAALIIRHEALRTHFAPADNVCLQIVENKKQSFSLSVIEINKRKLNEIIEEEASRTFDLSRGPLLRAKLLKLSSSEHILLMTFHHIVTDGWSLGIIAEDLESFYNGYASNTTTDLPEVNVQYADYAIWQRKWLTEERLDDQVSYWRKQLENIPALLNLPCDFSRPKIQDQKGNTIGLVIDAKLREALLVLSRRHKTTLFMTVLGAWSVLLSRLSGEQDIVIGTPYANRLNAEIEKTVGFFVNTLALRIRLNLAEDFKGLLAQVKETVIEAQQHADLPFEQVVEIVQPVRSLSFSPVFQSMFVWQHHDDTRLGLNDIEVEALSALGNIAKFDLTLNLAEEGDVIVGGLEYATSLFERETIERLLESFKVLLHAMVTDEGQSLAELPLLNDAGRKQRLIESAGPEKNYPITHLAKAFESCAEQHPKQLAVFAGDDCLSYSALNQRANQVAHALREKLHIQADSRIAVLQARDIDYLVAILAVLKTGAAYVPLDPDSPSERIDAILQDSQALALLTHSKFSVQQNKTSRDTIPQIDIGEDYRAYPVSNLNVDISPEQLAYVIYTSGSTGLPKGVMVEHRQILNELYAQGERYQTGLSDRHLQFVSLAFDVCVEDIFASLIHGAAVVMRDESWLEGTATFWSLCESYQVSAINLPALFFEQLMTSEVMPPSCIRRIAIGGEAVSEQALIHWFTKIADLKEAPQLYNVYGPTETSVCASAYAITQPETRAPIGRPLANVQLYILDREQALVPVGVAGELYIGGAGVARGYLNRPDEERARFIDAPWGENGAQARLYRTGDLARWRADGELEFLGRDDEQIKIRGFRVELGEIESHLQALPEVEAGVVVCRKESGTQRLVAYVVINKASPDRQREEDVFGEAIREQLGQRLPDYMVPSAYVILDSLPETANGKVDRKALPAPTAEAYLNRHYEAPKGEVENELASIWQALLGVERVGRHDHFFELGGHSLLAVTLAERVREAGYSVDVRSLFSAPTLKAFAVEISQQVNMIHKPQDYQLPTDGALKPQHLPLTQLTQAQLDLLIECVEGGRDNLEDIYPLAPLQEGILFHYLMNQEGDAYLSPIVFAFDTASDADIFIDALQAVIARHPILRTGIHWQGLSEAVQVVQKYAQLRVIKEDEVHNVESLQSKYSPAHYRLDIRRAPMLEVVTAEEKASGRTLLLLLLHHLVSDHSGLALLQEEMEAFMAGQGSQLGEVRPYRDFVAQARFGISEAEHEAYFQDLLGDVDEPTAPYGLRDIQGSGANIVESRLALSEALSKRMRREAQKQGVSVASLCHLAYAVLLSRVSGREDVVFGTLLFGRMGAGEASQALGLFINTLPMRFAVDDKRVVDSVQEVHRHLSSLLRHEHASLALAQRCSAVEAPSPLFSALLNYRHSGIESELESGIENEIESETKNTGKQTAPNISMLSATERTNYPFAFSVDDLGSGFEITAQVESPLDAELSCKHFATAIEALVVSLESSADKKLLSAQRINQVTILTEQEKAIQLQDWNATQTPYIDDASIYSLFEKQVEETPDAIALWQGDTQLTYRELNVRANRLAHYLRTQDLKTQSLKKEGDEKDQRIALCVERSPAMIIAILAIMKAGGAYVPLDPSYPLERLQFMLSDCEPVMLIVQDSVSDTVQQGLREKLHAGRPFICLSAQADQWRSSVSQAEEQGEKHLSETYNSTNFAKQSGPSDLAYVIYTSGSTGRPKGVMVEHRGICNLVQAQIRVFEIEADSRLLQFASFSFDACVSEIFTTLCRGACLVLAAPGEILVGDALVQSLAHYAITHVTLPPVVLANLSEDIQLDSVTTLVVAGEAPSLNVVQRWAKGRRFINAYGPTEGTVCASMYVCDAQANDLPPIGKPMDNVQLYVLDAHRQAVPVGVIGELYIGGVGLARGYLNQVELTAERFVEHPFKSGERLYRTGDLVRWNEKGELLFVGRQDFQVKLRGYRIELGDIESQLLRHEYVREAVVVAWGEEGAVTDNKRQAQRLIAYYVHEDEQEKVNPDSLRTYLNASLPDYMVPAAFIELPSLPLTSNGKVDRRALPAPDHDALSQTVYVEPEGEVECLLASIWSEVLQVEQVGRYDNFFELGGHSLLAVTLIERMRQADLNADVRALFNAPTLAELAEMIQDEQAIKRIDIPENRIPPDCTAIRPEHLPLIDLTQTQIDELVKQVPGGAGNIQDIYPLAPLQEGILFHHMMVAEGDVYLTPALLSFKSLDHVEAYIHALQHVIDRHDILRTAIQWEGLPEPVQVVWREAPLQSERLILDPEVGDIASQLKSRLDPRHTRIDVRKAPLMHVTYARDEAQERWVMMHRIHHLCADHTTLEVVQQEIQACLLDQLDSLPTPVPFRNFVAEARLGLSESEHEAFFSEMLADIEETTAPFGLADSLGDGSRIVTERIEVSSTLVTRLREQARRQGVSMASMCHLAYGMLLSQVSGCEDVVFGTLLFGRMHGGEGVDRVMGLCINTLPLRLSIDNCSVQDNVRRTHRRLAQLLHHEHAPLALAQRCSGVEAPSPLFSALLNYRHNADIAEPKNSEVVQDIYNGMQVIESEERTNYPFTIDIDEFSDGLLIHAQVEDSLNPGRICRYMEEALTSLASSLENDAELPLNKLPLMPEVEKQVQLLWSRSVESGNSESNWVHTRIEQQVESTPDALAIVDGQQRLSYAELNTRANQLAYTLRANGVKPDSRVAVLLPRSANLVIALLATHKAGGAYVPVDPHYPTERIAYMLEDSEPVIVITDSALAQATISNASLSVLDLHHQSSWQNAASENLPLQNLNDDHLAYIIYTSGSTGQPKGVGVIQRGFKNLLAWHVDDLALRAEHTTLIATSASFDLSQKNIFGPLMVGASIHLGGEPFDPQALLQQIQAESIRYMNLAPSAFHALIDSDTQGVLKQVQRVMLGGEAIQVSKLLDLPEPRPEIINNYGPTESSDVVAYHRLDADLSRYREGVPLGKAVRKLRLYVLNQAQQLLPIGAVGELCIGGIGLARGYLNKAELTAERFIENPFEAGERLYRTGDLARWTEDGELLFMGRQDFQVKIRGYRIELGDIESQLLRHKYVREAVVVAWGEEGPLIDNNRSQAQRLIAYYVHEEEKDKSEIETLRSYLSEHLPDYMVPAAFIALPSLPLTSNGKVDRRALPAPDHDALSQTVYVEPEGEVECLLASIWSEVLQVEQVGRYDNFFELGGHSLLAVTLIERMRQADLNADVRALFNAPTLSELAEMIQDEQAIKRIDIPENRIPPDCTAIRPEHLPLIDLTQTQIDELVKQVPGGAGNIQDIYPLAPLQEGILFHHMMVAEGDVYLTPALLSFKSFDHVEAYIYALQNVIARHDILRTAIQWEGLPEPVQVVWREAPLQSEQLQLDPQDGDILTQLKAKLDPRHTRIDVRKAPLMHVAYARDKAQERWVMMHRIHHLCADHTTLEVVQQEIQACLLDQLDTLPAPVPFRNFVAEARLGLSESEHEAFFSEMLADIEETTAPFGLADSLGDGSRIVTERIEVSSTLVTRLREQARRQGVSMASMCHLAYGMLLSQVSGCEDVVFGTLLFGRMHGGEGADRVLGLCINTLPLRLNIDNSSVQDSVRRTHRRLAQLLHHEHAPLALAQRCSGVEAPSPLFSALLNYRHSGQISASENTQALNQHYADIQVIESEERTNYPFTVDIDELTDGLVIHAQVESSLNPARICQYLEEALDRLASSLEDGDNISLNQFCLLPSSEKENILNWAYSRKVGNESNWIHKRIEQQVESTPDALAIIDGQQRLSYAELNTRANQLAYTLRANGVKPDSRVAVLLPRSANLVIALLATHKAGGAYVPVDPHYPTERIAYMLEDSEPVIVITDSALAQPAISNMPVLDLHHPSSWQHAPGENLPLQNLNDDHLAYIIYTSGSTGQPKGVGVIQRGFKNLLAWHVDDLALSAEHVTLIATSASFDLSQKNIFGPLMVGASIHLGGEPFDPQALLQQIQAESIRYMNLAPSAFHALIDSDTQGVLKQVQRVMLGGEAIQVSKLLDLPEPRPEIINNYGPTESSDVVAYHRLDADLSRYREGVPLGKAVRKLRLYVLNQAQQLLPIGAVGELCIGGIGLARGYLNKAELTAERFIENPFEAGERLYRTGDLARWTEDGELLFMGRQDFQVKIRGYRIELGDIESQLLRHKYVREAVVVAWGEDGVVTDNKNQAQRLIAYYVHEEEKDKVEIDKLRNYLSEYLPDYMVPAAFIALPSLPLTSNGKVDRRALPAPDHDALSQTVYVEPEGEVECLLSSIWSEVLQVEQVGRYDNFFELGGHSLLAVTLIERMRQADLNADVRALYMSPVLKDFSEAVEDVELVI